MQDVNELLAQAKAESNDCSDLKALDNLRVQYLGKKGSITNLMKHLGTLPSDERPKYGQIIN